MNFGESLEYLLNLGNEVLAMKLGLENIRILLAALRNPEKNYLKVQVAGTNGKGSTCAFLEAICVSAGIKVGLNTSPHLVSITERIRINGREIPEEDFARHATLVRETSEKLVENFKFQIADSKFDKSEIRNPKSQISLETVPTFFEQITAIALSFFSEAECELVILETGLGGRFDATTAANAEIVAITPVDYDHQRILGDTLARIASEKAAIIREDTRVVVAEQKEEAMNVILQRCANFGVTPKFAHFAAQITGKKENKFVVNFQTEKAAYKNVELNLLGKHQIENARTAILLAETLQDDFKITTANIIEGLQTAAHHGRLEFYKSFLFDGAHNVAGATALREFLDEFIEQPIIMVFGAMRDKDLAEIAEILFPKADKLILTKVENPRSLSAEELSEFAPQNFDKDKIKLVQNVRETLQTAQNIASRKDLICVTGSLYLVGEAQKILRENVNETDFQEK